MPWGGMCRQRNRTDVQDLVVLHGLDSRHGPNGQKSAVRRIVAPDAAPFQDLRVFLSRSQRCRFMNSASHFTEQHLVANGAPELFVEVFGASAGAHGRSAFGVAQIPFGSCVEIDLVAEGL